MPQFEAATYPTQIFWLMVCFGFLCIAMASYVVPRLTSILNDREQRLQEDWEQAKMLKGASESLRQESLRRLADTRGNAHSLIHQVIREIQDRKSAQVAALDEELAVKIKSIRHDLGAQTQHILDNLEPMVSEIVKVTALRVLGQNLAAIEIRRGVQNVLGKRKKT